MSDLILPGDPRFNLTPRRPSALDKLPVITLPAHYDVIHSSTHKRFTPWVVTMRVRLFKDDPNPETWSWLCRASSGFAAAFSCARYWYTNEKLRFRMMEQQWPDLDDGADVEQIDDHDYSVRLADMEKRCPVFMAFDGAEKMPTLFYGYEKPPKWWPDRAKALAVANAFKRPFFSTVPLMSKGMKLRRWVRVRPDDHITLQ